MVIAEAVKLGAEAAAEVKAAGECRAFFHRYIQRVRGWKVRAHQREWVLAMQALAGGELRDEEGKPTNKLMILGPPGSGKSELAMEFCEWVIGRWREGGRDPTVGYISYADDVSMERSKAIMETITAQRPGRGRLAYQSVFPAVRPNKELGWSQQAWHLEHLEAGDKDPTFKAIGLGGGIQSYRFDSLIVIDDPHDRRNIATAHLKEEVWRVYRDSIRTRATGATPLLLICTRWAEDDLAGRITAVEKGWKALHIKARDDDGNAYWPREEINGIVRGWTAEELEALELEDPLSFVTQYQCMPPSAAAQVFRWFSEAEPPADGYRVYCSWDTAYEAKRSADWTVGGTWLVKGGRAYLVDLNRGRYEFPALMQQTIALAEKAKEEWGLRPQILVEARASGVPLVQSLRERGWSAIARTPGYGLALTKGILGRRGGLPDLKTRASVAAQYFESSQVVLPMTWKPWKEAYVQELRAFGQKGVPDDQVAMTVLLLEHVFSHIVGELPRPRVTYGRV